MFGFATVIVAPATSPPIDERMNSSVSFVSCSRSSKSTKLIATVAYWEPIWLPMSAIFDPVVATTDS